MGAGDVAFKCTVGVLCGLLVGRLLGWLFFLTHSPVLRLSEHREGFVALGATFLSYGLTELAGGYGFLAVFTTACAIRAAERAHGFHNVLHDFVEQFERLLTAALLFLLGAFIALGGLASLTWQGAGTALVLLVVIRPLSGWAGLLGSRPKGRALGDRGLRYPRHRFVVLPRLRTGTARLPGAGARTVGGGDVHRTGLGRAARRHGGTGRVPARPATD